MRRGCIALGDIHCDDCGRALKSPERYLAIDEENNTKIGGGRTLRYCVDCCLKRGYAHYRVEKGEQVLTFLVD